MIYIVEALTVGDRNKHSYVVGAFKRLEQAVYASVAHENYRKGCKCVITEHVIGSIQVDQLKALIDSDVNIQATVEHRMNEYNLHRTLDKLVEIAQLEGEYEV